MTVILDTTSTEVVSPTTQNINTINFITVEQLKSCECDELINAITRDINCNYNIECTDNVIEHIQDIVKTIHDDLYSNVNIQLIGSSSDYTVDFEVKLNNKIHSTIVKRIIPKQYNIDILINTPVKITTNIKGKEINNIVLTRESMYLAYIYDILAGDQNKLPMDLKPKNRVEYILHHIYLALIGCINDVSIDIQPKTTKEIQLYNWFECIINNNINNYIPVNCNTRAEVYLNEIILTMLNISHSEPIELKQYRNVNEYMYMLIDDYYNSK